MKMNSREFYPPVKESKISILKMPPSSEYILHSNNQTDKNNRLNYVQLFINNEYKGIYSLGYVQKENKEKYE